MPHAVAMDTFGGRGGRERERGGGGGGGRETSLGEWGHNNNNSIAHTAAMDTLC